MSNCHEIDVIVMRFQIIGKHEISTLPVHYCKEERDDVALITTVHE